MRAIEEVRALSREPGPKGDPGVPGKDGRDGNDGAGLADRGVWSEGAFVKGDVVTFDGSLFIAQADTKAKPGVNSDWRLAVPRGERGEIGRSLKIGRTYDPSKLDYQELDVVVLNGSSFAARKDNPGPCPSEGWQLIASAGKRGERGEAGPRGERGLPGPSIRSAAISADGLLTLTNGDGTTVTCDFYPLFASVQK
jgi:hypothetical protein